MWWKRKKKKKKTKTNIYWNFNFFLSIINFICIDLIYSTNINLSIMYITTQTMSDQINKMMKYRSNNYMNITINETPLSKFQENEHTQSKCTKQLHRPKLTLVEKGDWLTDCRCRSLKLIDFDYLTLAAQAINMRRTCSCSTISFQPFIIPLILMDFDSHLSAQSHFFLTRVYMLNFTHVNQTMQMIIYRTEVNA